MKTILAIYISLGIILSVACTYADYKAGGKVSAWSTIRFVFTYPYYIAKAIKDTKEQSKENKD